MEGSSHIICYTDYNSFVSVAHQSRGAVSMWWMFYPFVTTIREKDINDDFVIPENRDEQHHHHMVCGAITIACIAIDLVLVIAMFANLLSVTDGLWGILITFIVSVLSLLCITLLWLRSHNSQSHFSLSQTTTNPQPHRRYNLWGYCFPHTTLHYQ